ncbi:MAG TPA: hypothetical protein PKA16_00170 [Ottowia sp.]|uniref:hypothetical protein n=1 Tax=Ottowia sp. TaxID=1898956 RepID=UPI002C1249C0|nr:hypothetical protein [Ottowia sp.]HMN19787.1 hypothetical protein [Ottowia sp.]
MRDRAIGRRQLLAVLGALGALGRSAPAAAAARELPLSRSLRAELAPALAARQPLVVMVSLHGCPWCKLVREHYLAPMHAQEGLPVVQIDMGSRQATETAGGAPTTHEALIKAWGVTMAPTLLFLGRGGQEVAERLEGGSPDFYSAYLDDRLERARRALAG